MLPSGCLYQEEIKVSCFLEFKHHFQIRLYLVRYVPSQFGFFYMFCFRLDELRHRLIPLYSYDPAEEQEDWGDADKEDDEKELAVSKPLKLY